MTAKTTTNLSLPVRAHVRAYLAQRDPLALVSATVITLLLIGLVIRRLVLIGLPVSAAPTSPLPIIIIATAPAAMVPTAIPVSRTSAELPAALPRYVVAFDAPNGAVLGPIPAPDASAITARYGDDWLQTTWQGSAIWIRSADLGMRLANVAPAPAAVVQPVYAEAAPTPAGALYQAANESAQGDFYTTPPNTSLEARQALIGDDPNALACNGSALCGGLTNAQAQAALDQEKQRQTNIQDHYVAAPTIAPMEVNDVTRSWAAEQYRQEHPEMKAGTP